MRDSWETLQSVQAEPMHVILCNQAPLRVKSLLIPYSTVMAFITSRPNDTLTKVVLMFGSPVCRSKEPDKHLSPPVRGVLVELATTGVIRCVKLRFLL